MKAYKIIGLSLNILITALCAGAIVYYSSRDGEQTYQDSIKITRYAADTFFRREFSPNELAELNIQMREWAHVALYAMLGAVSGLWVQWGRSHQARVKLLALMGAICVTAGFADEWLKQYVEGRHYHLSDFFLNAASSLAGLFICCLIALCVRAVSYYRGMRRDPSWDKK
jgi:VanZ family protein